MPEGLLQLKKLKVLSLNDNQFEKIPAGLLELPLLEVLYLGGNPLQKEEQYRLERLFPSF